MKNGLFGYIMYACFLAGLIVVFSSTTDASNGRKRLFFPAGIRRKLRNGCPYIRMLSSFLNRDEGPLLFTGSQILAFVFTFIVGVRSLRLLPALFLSVFSAALPLLFLMLFAAERRSRAGREAKGFVCEIYRNYGAAGGNIYEALNHTVRSADRFPVLGKILDVTMFDLCRASGREELKACLQGFSQKIGTDWGRLLSFCIYRSALRGTDISCGLSYIIRTLDEREHVN